MADRSIRLLLAFGCLVCCAVGASAVAAVILLPLTESTESVAPQHAPLRLDRPAEQRTRVLNAEQFQYVWRKPLQNPIVDPAAVKPAIKAAKPKVVATPKPDPIRFDGTLVGTIVDSDATLTRAWLLIKKKRRMVAEGQVLSDLPGQPVVTAIGDRSVDVTIGEKQISLSLPAQLAMSKQQGGEDEK